MRTTSRIIGAMEICNGAFDTITGHGRSASAGAIRAAPTAPVVVQVVPGGGGTQAVTTAGHVVCTTGHLVSDGGQRVSTAGQRVSCGHCVSTGEAEHADATGGQVVCVTGHCV
jgi:hypothetical protein